MIAASAASLAQHDSRPDPSRMPARVALLARAEAELARGDSAASLDDFERAAMMLHAPDAEMGLIRAALQDGQYRRALAFCAHTAGEHVEATGAVALYAWLLRAGGQPALAQLTLEQALAHAPADPVVSATARAFAATLPVARGPMLDLPHRMAPWPTMMHGQPQVPESASLISGAVLLGDGSKAVMPFAAAERSKGSRLWVRNGLGQTTEAFFDDSADAPAASAGVASLRLRVALSRGADSLPARREPFAGSPGYVVQFADTAQAAWPWLRQGFFGGSAEGGAGAKGGGLRRLGFDASGGASGAAVLDRSGRLAGITLTASGANAVWLPIAPPDPAPASEPSAPVVGGLVAPDFIYEVGLHLALQVIADIPSRTSGKP
jgi:hypothetical protein